MRIELPLSAWAEARYAQDDAHTLTVPAQQLASEPMQPGLPHGLPQLLAAAADTAGISCKIEVALRRPPVLTLTF